MLNRKSIFLLIYCWSFSVLCASKDNPYEGLSPILKDSLIEYRIDSIRKTFESIGLYAVAVNNSKIVYSKSFGYNPDYSDPTKRDPIRSDDLFLIASVSKTFVGTAIMQLVKKKKLSLDDDVNMYLDYSVRNPRYPLQPITIRMLLCHRSGLKRNSPFDNFLNVLKSGDKDKLTDLFEDFAPNTKLSYSNIGFDLLGAVIENITNIRFDDYIEKKILKPLGINGGYDILRMDSTRFVRTYSYKNDRFVNTNPIYWKKKVQKEDYKLGYSTTVLWPAGGMVISATDLAKYMIAHINKGKLKGRKRILRKRSEEMLWEKQAGSNHGLSFVHFTTTLPDIELIGMTGGAYGIHSAMLFNPEKKIGFVVICNGCTSKSADGMEMNKKIMSELYLAYCAE